MSLTIVRGGLAESRAAPHSKAYIGYWSFHLAIWLVGLSAWYRFNSVFLPWPANPVWLIVTLVTSLVLLILYKPITSILRKLVAPVQRA